MFLQPKISYPLAEANEGALDREAWHHCGETSATNPTA